jgi:hypothetical protein
MRRILCRLLLVSLLATLAQGPEIDPNGHA